MKAWVDCGLCRAAVILLATISLVGATIVRAQKPTAQSSAPSRQPVLRIELGMHTTDIKRISIDQENRYLVTASDDKTARVWELATGKLLRVLRPPIGAGPEGNLYAVALSPDGRTVAVGGWTGFEWDNHYSIYIFDRESGRMVRRIPGMLNAVTHLVYSHDGQYLAVVIGGKQGVQVYQSRTYALVGEGPDYGDQSYGADFDGSNRLATVCLDGFIRLYEFGGGATKGEGFRLVAKQKAVAGKWPFTVAFSPDGSRLAIGFADSPKVNVLNGRDLSLLYTPLPPGEADGDLSRVAWSVDGARLYASGTGSKANNHAFIREWTNGGRGDYQDFEIDATSTVGQILPLRDGGVVFASFDPTFGTLDAEGKTRLLNESEVVDYHKILNDFQLAADGTTVQWVYKDNDKSRARFSPATGKLGEPSQTESLHTPLHPPITTASGLVVSGWNGTYEPKLNGKPLKIDDHELAHSLAIAPDKTALLLGGDFYLYLFDINTSERWKVSIPGAAWGLNISADGRFAVVACDDGTIRWYRMTDGKELLAFFPHKDHKRWVAWTPAGYYHCSPGAEDFIGWHVNSGRDVPADFFPTKLFHDTHYRPDVIAKILETGDEARAIALANQAAGRQQLQASIAEQLPPIVEIISPSDNSEAATRTTAIQFRIRIPSGEPVTEVRAFVNGLPVSARNFTRPSATDDTRELRVTLLKRDNTVSLIARNRFRAGQPAIVHLKLRGAQASPRPSQRRRP